MPNKPQQISLPLDLTEELEKRYRTIPGVGVTDVVMEVFEPYLVRLEQQRFELRDPRGGVIIKLAGDAFPQRLNDRFRWGRPASGRERTDAGQSKGAKLYLEPDVWNRVRNAAWWRCRPVSWDVIDALREAWGIPEPASSDTSSSEVPTLSA